MLTQLLRLHTRHFPYHVGKSWAQRYLHGHLTGSEVRATKDGFLLELDNHDFLQRSINITGEWDREIAQLIRQRMGPGKVFLDVGANIGYFSLLAAHCGAEVIAVEPNPVCVEKFHANIARNKAIIELHPVALGQSPGEARLHIDRDDNLGGGSVSPVYSAGNAIKVPVDTLDHIVKGRRIDLIKMDIEGAEVQTLLGARQTLADCAAIVCEVSEYSLKLFGNSKDQLFDIMNSHGFVHRILSPIRKSNASQRAAYFQYDVLFEKAGAPQPPGP